MDSVDSHSNNSNLDRPKIVPSSLLDQLQGRDSWDFHAQLHDYEDS